MVLFGIQTQSSILFRCRGDSHKRCRMQETEGRHPVTLCTVYWKQPRKTPLRRHLYPLLFGGKSHRGGKGLPMWHYAEHMGAYTGVLYQTNKRNRFLLLTFLCFLFVVSLQPPPNHSRPSLPPAERLSPHVKSGEHSPVPVLHPPTSLCLFFHPLDHRRQGA